MFSHSASSALYLLGRSREMFSQMCNAAYDGVGGITMVNRGGGEEVMVGNGGGTGEGVVAMGDDGGGGTERRTKRIQCFRLGQ